MKSSLINSMIFAFITVGLSGCFNSDPAVEAVDTFIASQKIDKTQANWKTNLVQPELVTFDADAQYFWDLETSQGKMSILLRPDVAPMHVTSTMYLTKLGFYDDLVFHRVIKDFMAQGGDPLGNGQGNPGYKYQGEFSDALKHDKAGLLSMANAGPNTDGSQFFITFKSTPWLDGKHTIFGEVVKGADTTLAAIEALGSRSGRTKEDIKIVKATIRVE